MITPDEVRELATLARIALRDDELADLRADLTAILDHVAAIAAVDTAGVEPMTHAVPMTLRLRPDAPGPSLPAEVALAAAPATDAGHFVVPAIIPGSEDR